MRLLALESSTDWLSVAVGDGERWHERRERAGRGHSERMLPLVDEVLADAQWTLESLDGIAFGAGPGAFTGVRIACGVAQGLALGADLALVPVSTLTAVAHEAWRAHGRTAVFACLDARMREVYVAALAGEGTSWREHRAPSVAKPDDVEAVAGAWFGAGDGLAQYPHLATRLALDGHDAALVPTARAVGALAAPVLAAGGGVPPEDALPLYVRHRVALTTAERDAGERL
jgi:tRNA threonylcarbamoyladenosine biosynthesis protein TsaB